MCTHAHSVVVAATYIVIVYIYYSCTAVVYYVVCIIFKILQEVRGEFLKNNSVEG